MPAGRGGCLHTSRMATSLDDVKTPRFWRALFAEFLGTMLLTFVGCGSCIGWEPKPSVVQIALAFGLSVATMVWCIGSVSGGHINPAVTVAMLITRKVRARQAPDVCVRVHVCVCMCICMCVSVCAGV